VRKIGAAGIADKDRRAAARESFQPVHRRPGQIFLVSHVSGQDDLPAFVLADQVFEARRDGYPVLRGVGFDRGDGESVNVAAFDRPGAAQGGGDRDEPRAGGKVERAPARDKGGLSRR